MHFGEAKPRLHLVARQSRRAAEPGLECTVQQNLQSVPLGECPTELTAGGISNTESD